MRTATATWDFLKRPLKQNEVEIFNLEIYLTYYDNYYLGLE